MEYQIRTVKEGDGKQIVSIFNHYIENGFAAYMEKKVGIEIFHKFHQAATLFLVLEFGEEVVGFGFFRPYLEYKNFSHSAMLTYFILPEHTGKGQGSQLLKRLTKEASGRKIETLLAHISSKNRKSLSFHRHHGFKVCGRFKEVGRKKGQYFDVVWMQKFIQNEKYQQQ